MSLLKEAGTYIASPESWGMKIEEGKCPRFAMLFRCKLFRFGGDWQPVEGEERITGFFTLVNKDGSGNEINLRALHDALGWDGQSFGTLDSTDWSKTEVQIVVGEDTYNGNTKLEVKYLNPRDYTGKGLDKAEPQAVQSLDMKYGGLLRNIFKTGAKPNGTNGKPAPNRSAVVVTPDATSVAKQKAWESFMAKTPDYSTDKRIAKFKEVAATVRPGKELRDLAADDWSEVTKQITDSFEPALGELVPY